MSEVSSLNLVVRKMKNFFFVRFLKAACTNENCLLSHDASLSKMPTCKFFLLGQCAKSDCQYLHKKVNDKTAICHDFLKGYCPKAEKVKRSIRLRQNGSV